MIMDIIEKRRVEILKSIVRNPMIGLMMHAPQITQQEAIQTLKDQFGFTGSQIQRITASPEMHDSINESPTIKVKRDYYGNKAYGKRAYWVLDENNELTGDFFFVGALDNIREEYNVEIVNEWKYLNQNSYRHYLIA